MAGVFRRIFRILVILSLAGPGPVAAFAAPAGGFSDADRRDIARVETYLNGLRSVQAGFLQISGAGQVAEGKIYLQRPKKLRLDYRAPAGLQVYADGYWLVFIDTELQEITHVPLSATPAGFLVAETVRLSGDVTVTRLERGAKSLRVHVVQTKEPGAGRIILSLSDEPLRLRNWKVIDAQGIETRISLINPKFNLAIDGKLFQYDDSKFENSDLR